MLKKFVEVNAECSPSANPYEVRTFLGNETSPEWKAENCPPRDRVCQKKPPNSTISQVLTIEDELRRIHQKAEESRFIRPYKKQCALYDEYTMCIIPQRTPAESWKSIFKLLLLLLLTLHSCLFCVAKSEPSQRSLELLAQLVINECN